MVFTNEQIIPAHKRLDKGDIFWLVYLVFFLIEPFAQHSLRLWVETFGFTFAFVALYVLFLRFCDLRVRLLVLAGMFALGMLAYPQNGGATCFMIYAGSLLPFALSSVPWILASFIAGSLLLAAEGLWLHISPYSWFSGILLLLSIGGSNIFFAQKQRADRKLRMQQEEIEALAAVAERERIARDLHDVLGHTLSVIVLKTELAGRLLQRELETAVPRSNTTDLERAHAELLDVERTARTALTEVREAIGGYRARGLPAEIDAARRTLAAAGVTLHTTGVLPPGTLPAAEETVLALALREAVTNIVRHAHATACLLQIRMVDGSCQLTIQDNGPQAVLREGNGLRGMRERIEAVGGQLLLTHEQGTHLAIQIPYPG